MKKLFGLIVLCVLACALPARAFAASPEYKVGDYYEKGNRCGIVFSIEKGGRHGKIIALDDAPKKMVWNDACDWCEGERWELPTRNDLLVIYKNKEHLNSCLLSAGGSPITNDKYWSCDESFTINGFECAWYVRMRNGGQSDFHKNIYNCIRPVWEF